MSVSPLFEPSDEAADVPDPWAADNIRLRQRRDELNEAIRIASLTAEIRLDADEACYL